MLRRLVPPTLKRTIRLAQRRMSDWASGRWFRLATRRLPAPETGHFYYEISLSQPFLPSSTLEQKRHNIRLAAAGMEDILINPGEIFSFWRLVGAPSRQRGYRSGRNIVGGKLSEAVGGGLCQLSSILYHSALQAGLEVLERHPHTYDLYWDCEDQRYAPLGADATVVYGYKDLRIRNTGTHPLLLQLEINEDDLVCRWLSPAPIETSKVVFSVRETGDVRLVSAVVERPQGPTALPPSLYRRLKED